MPPTMTQAQLRCAAPRAAAHARAAPAAPAPRPACRPQHRRASRLACAAASKPAPASADAASRPGTAGRMTYKPQSYNEIVADAVRALLAGIADGERMMEVEFPPLPSSKDAYKGSSDEFIDANITLALAAAKLLNAAGKTVQVLVPDGPELRRAEQRHAATLSLLGEATTFGALSGSRKSELEQLGAFFFGTPAKATESLTRPADVYLMVNASAIELPEFERFCTDTAAPLGATVVAFNLELETARGDLGLPGFPSKDLQHRFLCRFKPALFLRQRSYSKTVNVAPFLLNYDGATFREYPGPWQVMLRTDNGQLACIAERPERYGLGEAKEEMMAAMGLNTEEEGSSMEFLRRGYKTATWWEEATNLDASSAWRM